MSDTFIRDANGHVIGELRPNQDPNAPQRFVEDAAGNLFVDTGDGKLPANAVQFDVEEVNVDEA